jgi:hypothetical protein
VIAIRSSTENRDVVGRSAIGFAMYLGGPMSYGRALMVEALADG